MNRMLTELSFYLCRSTDSIFRSYEKTGNVVYADEKLKRDRYIYVDNGSNILAVAHIDTVLDHYGNLRPGEKLYSHSYKKGHNKITSIQLDDRLGYWVITDYLPNHLGLKFDILLTEDEEIGASTAMHFITTKTYNWVFEFDRRGSDCLVMYQYDDVELRETFKDYGFRTEIGSFSDICYLDNLGCKGFNFGVGYHGEHAASCSVILEDTLRSCKKFAKFYKNYHDIKLEHVYTPKKSYYRGAYDYEDWDTEVDWRTGHSYVYSNYTPSASTTDSGTQLTKYTGKRRQMDCLICGQLFYFDELIDGMYCEDCLKYAEAEGMHVRKEELPHVVCADCGDDISYENQHELEALFGAENKLCDDCYVYYIGWLKRFLENNKSERLSQEYKKLTEEGNIPEEKDEE